MQLDSTQPSSKKLSRFSEVVACGTTKRTPSAQETHEQAHQWTAQPSAHLAARLTDEMQQQITQAVDCLLINGKKIARTRLAQYRLAILTMHRHGASSRRITMHLQEAYNLRVNSSNVRRFIQKEMMELELMEVKL